MAYGVEIWGWKEREAVERVHERYLRWLLGISRMTPGYMVREELQREKLRTRAGRAWRMEERLAEGRGSELTRGCWEEVREKTGREGLSEWERERQSFFEERGEEVGKLEKEKEEGWYDFAWQARGGQERPERGEVGKDKRSEVQ